MQVGHVSVLAKSIAAIQNSVPIRLPMPKRRGVSSPQVPATQPLAGSTPPWRTTPRSWKGRISTKSAMLEGQEWLDVSPVFTRYMLCDQGRVRSTLRTGST